MDSFHDKEGRVTGVKVAEELAYLENPARDREAYLKKVHETGMTPEQQKNLEVMDGLTKKFPNAFVDTLEASGQRLLILKPGNAQVNHRNDTNTPPGMMDHDIIITQNGIVGITRDSLVKSSDKDGIKPREHEAISATQGYDRVLAIDWTGLTDMVPRLTVSPNRHDLWRGVNFPFKDLDSTKCVAVRPVGIDERETEYLPNLFKAVEAEKLEVKAVRDQTRPTASQDLSRLLED